MERYVNKLDLPSPVFHDLLFIIRSRFRQPTSRKTHRHLFCLSTWIEAIDKSTCEQRLFGASNLCFPFSEPFSENTL